MLFMGFGYYIDTTYLLVLLGLALCVGASALVNGTMKKYGKIRSSTGMTGAEAAQRILHYEGLYNVQVECLQNSSGDHYDPRTNTVRLSYEVYNNHSASALQLLRLVLIFGGGGRSRRD